MDVNNVTREKIKSLSNEELRQLENKLTAVQRELDETWDFTKDVVGRESSNHVVQNIGDSVEKISDALAIIQSEMEQRMNNNEWKFKDKSREKDYLK